MEIIEEFFQSLFSRIQTKIVWIVTLIVPFTVFVLWLVKQRRTKFRVLNKKSAVLSVMLGGFLATLCSLTLLNREVGSVEKSFEWRPLWSYQEAILEGNRILGSEIVFNILLFIPFGILMAVFFKAYGNVKWTAKVATILSLIIELTQGGLKIGLFEFDDILNNVLGAVIGVWVWSLRKCRKKKGTNGR